MTSAFLQCVEQRCERRYPLDAKEHQCAECGGLLDVQYDFPQIDSASLRLLWQQRKMSSAIIDQSGVWRFRELLPFVPAGAEVISLSEGRTPLIEVNRTGEWAGGVRLAIKHQGNNPTGSFKDLGMTACITQACRSRQPRHCLRLDWQYLRFDGRLRCARRNESRRFCSLRENLHR